MTLEELKEEAKKHGYKLQKLPTWDCDCCVAWPNHARKKKDGQWKCMNYRCIQNANGTHKTHCVKMEV